MAEFKESLGFKTTHERSLLMKKIKGKDTKIEVALRKALWAKGFRYRKNFKGLPGSPDIVFTKVKLAIFVDGEFWHGFEWEKKKERIKANRDFWIPKIERNMQRDIENNEALKVLNHTVIRLWEKDVKKHFDQTLDGICEQYQLCLARTI